MRFANEDRRSGDAVWQLIAPNQNPAAAVLANFRQVAGDGKLFVHPVVPGVREGKSAAAGA